MNRRIKKLVRERRVQMRAELREQRARLKEIRARVRPPKRRWRRRTLIILLLLLLLLLLQCPGEGPVGVPPRTPKVEEPQEKEIPKVPTNPKKPITKKLKKRARPSYEGTAPRRKAWLDAYRLQVSARSVRLSACFEGADRPGTVRWVAAVDPVTGKVTDHTLEPIASSVDLTRKQKRCVIQALSDPPYRLSTADAPKTPERVGLALEF